MKTKKRVAAIITEYWDISHADVIITKMLEGFNLDGYTYTSTLEIASMYIDKFPDNDIGRELAAKHQVPLYAAIAEALKCGGDTFELDGIILIGEHGDYPENERRQILYPRRAFFEACLNVMIEAGRFVPVYTDKGYAILEEDIKWMYEQIKKYNIPFMSSSVIPYCKQTFDVQPQPAGAPITKMFGFSYDGPGEAPERYMYHSLEMLQSVAEYRAGGESGIARVRAIEGKEAVKQALETKWHPLYMKLGSFLNFPDMDQLADKQIHPYLLEIDYSDGLEAGIFFADQIVWDFGVVVQLDEHSEPRCRGFWPQPGKPYSHFGTLVLEIEKFIHTGRPPFPVERSYLTTGTLASFIEALYEKREVETPHLQQVIY
ncbi:hypothetical protein [Paenibacillus eucommiae]|uniref:Uncharacterized protein n=1 Tax=Paenibacillus eucommiae TaxID=1355755 RepID=A0ABS4IRA9_9BACL|nr:hypothetical protein [Paenibacillus eucommiae]MBP1990098.1 hypothetical protein [Paenibacillus eucommiae]